MASPQEMSRKRRIELDFSPDVVFDDGVILQNQAESPRSLLETLRAEEKEVHGRLLSNVNDLLKLRGKIALVEVKISFLEKLAKFQQSGDVSASERTSLISETLARVSPALVSLVDGRSTQAPLRQTQPGDD